MQRRNHKITIQTSPNFEKFSVRNMDLKDLKNVVKKEIIHRTNQIDQLIDILGGVRLDLKFHSTFHDT